jgi:hypothetical protein
MAEEAVLQPEWRPELPIITLSCGRLQLLGRLGPASRSFPASGPLEQLSLIPPTTTSSTGYAEDKPLKSREMAGQEGKGEPKLLGEQTHATPVTMAPSLQSHLLQLKSQTCIWNPPSRSCLHS